MSLTKQLNRFGVRGISETIVISKQVKVGIVIPTRNAESNLELSLPSIRKAFPSALIFGIDDQSKDRTKEVLKKYGAIIPYRYRKTGYGISLIEGLAMAYYEYGCDVVVEMDADHPTSVLPLFIDGVVNKGYQVVLGSETGRRASRSVAGFLSKAFLGLRKFPHPTCGYVAFSNEALKRIFERKPSIARRLLLWYVPSQYPIKANNDFVHIELLYRAKRAKLVFGEVNFSGKEHKKHMMRPMRVFSWLKSFAWLAFRRWTYHVYVDFFNWFFNRQS